MRRRNSAASLADERGAAPVRAFWCRIPSRPNFGDFVGPWLVKQLTGRYPRFTWPDEPHSKYLIGGSIVGYATAGCTVWGSGVMRRDEVICPDAKLLAVRGPLTRRRALECGAWCPEIYGDPALLLPRFYRPTRRPPTRLGIVAHFSDMPRLVATWKPRAGVQLIDVQDPIETVIDHIAACELVASSSLHGLIVGHAYGVPATWIEFQPLPSGDRTKFQDYLASVGRDDAVPLELDYDRLDVAAIAERAELPRVPIDTNPMWQACPFRT